MSEKTAWAPGPWGWAHREGSDGMYRTQVSCVHGQTIATFDWYAMPENEHGVVRTSRSDNAKLCAAAPDLYAALEALQRRIVEADLWHGQEDELSAASAALAKARGESV